MHPQHGRRHSGSRRLRPWALLLSAALAIGLLAGSPALAGTTAPVTYKGSQYSSAIKFPTQDKPQSKLWYADGAWWALMLSGADNFVHIFELMPDHSWRDTEVVVDTRTTGTGDALWTGQYLYVASRQASTPLRVTRFTYNSVTRAWLQSSGFPVTVGAGGSESATIDIDTTGMLWVTYTRAKKVWVSHTTTNDRTWTTAYTPAVPGTSITADDLSSVVSFNNSIGLLWSDQVSDRFHFALHQDGTDDRAWTYEVALAGAGMADDHINLKALTSDSQGRLFAVIKTSRDDVGSPGDTSIAVLTRRADGTWRMSPVATVADDLTRPILMLDETNQELYVFATTSIQGGSINYKKTSLSNISFPSGRGDPFVYWPKRYINNATGSKQPVNARTGMVVLASDGGIFTYFHAEMAIAGSGTPLPDTTAPSIPKGLQAAPVSSSQIDLSWAASSDDVGVTQYVVRRNGAEVARPTGTSFSDKGLTAATSYSYTVSARDAAGNESGQSTAATATTPASQPPPSQGVSLRAAGSAANAGAATLNVRLPANERGDLLVVAVAVRGKPTITAPAGWSLVRLDVNGTALESAVYTRISSGAEPSGYSWGFSSSTASAVARVLVYAGVNQTSPVAARAGQVNAASATITAPSIQAVSGVIVGLFATNGQTTIDPPAQMTERVDVTAPDAPYKITAEAADQAVSSPGATGVRSATSRLTAPNIGQLLSLRPAG
ncbi:MAG TPA: fibronectin type III domain-containing protein [Actinomycetales bacterium]|nr:fibronectin type III domain-containing protein [Actinomycetales bacterium]